MPVVGIIVGGLIFAAGAWLWKKRHELAQPIPQGRGLTGRGRTELEHSVQARQQRGSPDRVVQASMNLGEAGAAAGAAIGAAAGTVVAAAGGASALAAGAFLGPAGFIIGLGLGLYLGALLEAIEHETYGRIVREAIAGWLGDHGFPSTAKSVDATLFRNALLGARHVYRSTAGELAVEVLGREGGELVLSLFGGAFQGPDAPFIVGPASSQGKQQIVAWSPGQLDGPGQRSRNADWTRAARVGDLHVIEFVPASSRWRTPGYAWFHELWPLINFRPIAKSARWVKVTPTADNVDGLAAGFDRAANVVWA